MADLWMLFPTEEEYLQVGAAGALDRGGAGCSQAVLRDAGAFAGAATRRMLVACAKQLLTQLPT